MKKICSFTLIGAITLFYAQAAEFIRNPLFEDTNRNGVPAKWVLRDTPIKPGSPSRKVENPAISVKDGVLCLDGDEGRSEVMLIQFELPLKRGEKYVVDFEVKGDKNTAYRGVVHFQTNSDTGTRTWKNTLGNWNKAPQEWQKVRIPFIFPSDGSSPYFYITATGGGKVEFRNLQFRKNELYLSSGSDLLVFEPGKTVVFRPELKQASENIVRYRLTDFKEREVTKGFTSGDEIRLEQLPLGYFLLSTEELTPEGERINVATVSFAIIPEVSSQLQLNPHNQFGVMVNPHTFYPYKQKERDVLFASRIGAKYIRTHRLSWHRVQSKPDSNFNWNEADAEIALYRKHGMRAVATIGWPVPQWASSAAGTNAPNKISYFPKEEYLPVMRTFYQELAARYADDIAYFEVGNEVDANNFWMGRYENALKGDNQALLQDYIEFYIEVASAVLSGNPHAKIGPGVTGKMPDGVTYKPWMNTFWSNSKALGYTNIFCPHYKVNIPEIKKTMKKHGKVVPVVITEIGGLIKSEDYNINLDRQRQLIKRTYSQFVPQLNAGGLALCKFLLRQIPEVKEGWISEMLSADYGIRAEYPAFATLIRMTAEGVFERELNLIKNSSSGWVEAYLVKNGERNINIIMLHDTNKAKVWLHSPEVELEIMDVMGNSHKVLVSNGKIELIMHEDSPLFVIGKVSDNPGQAIHPEPKLVQELMLTLKNPGFEFISENKIDHWGRLTDEIAGSAGNDVTFVITTDTFEKTEGEHSVKMVANKQTKWYGILTELPWNKIPKPKTGEFMIITITYDQKTENVIGTGAGVTLAWRKKDMTRVSWGDGNWTHGSHDWMTMTKSFRLDSIPQGAEKAYLEFYMGKATGIVWIDNVNVKVELYRRSNASSAYIN
jgi:hypothetical protein